MKLVFLCRLRLQHDHQRPPTPGPGPPGLITAVARWGLRCLGTTCVPLQVQLYILILVACRVLCVPGLCAWVTTFPAQLCDEFRTAGGGRAAKVSLGPARCVAGSPPPSQLSLPEKFSAADFFSFFGERVCVFVCFIEFHVRLDSFSLFLNIENALTQPMFTGYSLFLGCAVNETGEVSTLMDFTSSWMRGGSR